MRIDNDGGFTLIEALVALIIIIASATILYRGLSSNLRIANVADRSEEALLVAKAHLAVLGVEAPLQTGVSQGQEGDMSWQVTLRPYGSDNKAGRAAQMTAFWATATVSWRNGREAPPRTVTLTTIKLGPAQ